VSKHDAPLKVKKYKSKMSYTRTVAPKSQGGLGLWNWQHRSDAYLVKLNSMMMKINQHGLGLALEKL